MKEKVRVVKKKRINWRHWMEGKEMDISSNNKKFGLPYIKKK